MRPLPSSKYRLPKEKKPFHKSLRREEKKIFKAYSSIRFSPSSPECTPIRALFDLYSGTDPEVLYFRLAQLHNRISSSAIFGNSSVGVISGIVSGAIISCADIVSGQALSPVSLIAFFILSLILTLAMICSIRILFPFIKIDPMAEKRIDMMYEILELDKYFNYSK